jgi:hypothetical protein
MRKLVTLMVALALVVTVLMPVFSAVSADTDSEIRGEEANTPATMIVKKWAKVGYDYEGNMLNPSTLDYTLLEREQLDGTGYRLFSWQKEDEQVWGRASDDSLYQMPRLLPNATDHHWLGRFDPTNYDFDYDNNANNYAWYTEIYLTVEPNAGGSQEIVKDKWYAVIDRSGSLYLDPDGKFHNASLDFTADPMYYEDDNVTYAEGSCDTNPGAFIDPIPSNNTQGPYDIDFEDINSYDKIYFWWKYDTNDNLIDRLWRIGWADNCDYTPIPYPDLGWEWDNPSTWSTISYIPTYDPYTMAVVDENSNNVGCDVDWDAKLDFIRFPMASAGGAWPSVAENAECYADANGNERYDPFEYIYRKGPGPTGGTIEPYVQENDVRISSCSYESADGNYKTNYRAGSMVGPNDFDAPTPPFPAAPTTVVNLLPFNHMNAPANYPEYVHTHNETPDGEYDRGEFIYQRAMGGTVFGNSYLLYNEPNNEVDIYINSEIGFDVNDEIAIYDPSTETYHLTSIDSIDTTGFNPYITIDDPLPRDFSIASTIYEIGYTEIGDIRLTEINERHNNNSRSWDWHGAWWTDALILLEVLEGGCHTPKYNITVESDMWMGGYPENGAFKKGDMPSETSAMLRSPNGDIVEASQRIQKTTVLDPTGLDFMIPATTFEDIKLEYREYLGLELFKDDGVNNNLGEPMDSVNCIRGSVTDDYVMYDSTEEFVGARDIDTAADFGWSTSTQNFTLERFVDVGGDGQLGSGEPMYRDVDNSLDVSAGDVRITDVVIETDLLGQGNIITFPAGSVVTVGDADVNFFPDTMGDGELDEIPVTVGFHDLPHGCVPANDRYDIGEPIYMADESTGGRVPTLELPTVDGWATDYGTYFSAYDESNSFLNANPAVSVEDPLSWFPSPNEVVVADPGNGAVELVQGQVILDNAPVSANRLDTTVQFEPTDWNSTFGIVFRWQSPNDYWVLYMLPNPDSTSDAGICGGVFGPWILDFEGGQDTIRYTAAYFVDGVLSSIIPLTDVPYTNWGNPFDVAIENAGNISAITLNDGSTWNLGPLPATGGRFGYTRLVDGFEPYEPAYIYSSILSSPSDVVRLNDVWVDGIFYKAGTRVLAGDFYRLHNPVYGASLGLNNNPRCMDIEVLPGDIGLKYEIDGKTPDDDDFEGLKVEKTSHVKVYLDHELEGVYAKGKVIGDKRSRLFYRPDSFYVNMIPAKYQVIYSSPQEAERNFYSPHRSINGDKVFITLRDADVNPPLFGAQPGDPMNNYLEEVMDTTAIIDADKPAYEFEFTPYKGTIIDDLGQELPYLLKAYMDDGGIGTAPRDSRFTYSFMPDKNAAERTIDPGELVYYESNYVDPWHVQRKWEIDEAYANFYNQAYTRAARVVPSPYEADFMDECGLSDKYDCLGYERLHVAPEGINIIPGSPCVDPIGYRYPNVTLKLRAFDNPNDINDPAGFPMCTSSVVEDGIPFATYNCNGAGIRYMCTMKYWNIAHTVNEREYYSIVQVNDDGSYLAWVMSGGMYPNMIDPLDTFSTWSSMYYPFLQKFNNRGNDGHDLGDYDCSIGTGIVDLCGTGWPPLGDITPFDTYGTLFCDPVWNNPDVPGAPYYGVVEHYGVRSFITPTTETSEGGEMSVVCQPMNANSKLNIRVHTSNLIVDYNSTTAKHGDGVGYFNTQISGVHQADAQGATWDPSISRDYRTNPPGIRNYSYKATVDYCDVISLKVLQPDTELNFNNIHVVDHALQYSDVIYSSGTGNGLATIQDPTRWIQPDYNPLCVFRPLSSDENTDVRCYPGGQTHLMRVENSLKGNGFNATPALWRKQFNKLGSEFFGLTDYGLFFELTTEEAGYWGLPLSFADGHVKRIEVKGPFITPLDLDPEFDSIKYRSGTGQGSTLGYSYKGLRFVPIKYDRSGQIVVDKLNYMTYELGMSDYTYTTSPACTVPGDFIQFTNVNSHLWLGKELDYRYVVRPSVNLGGQSYSSRVFIFDEIIPVGPGRIEITVWLEDGTKAVFEDCCTEPPAEGIDVSGINIEGMPHFITVDEENKLELKLTEGYGIESKGPPPEFGAGIQQYKECNDALVYVWQDKGIYDPVEKLYDFAGDGYCSMAPQSTEATDIYSPYTEDDDINSDGKIMFEDSETEIIGCYDVASGTWESGLIDARTFHRQNGIYKFNVKTDTVGRDFGSFGSEAEPDHIISPDEMLDVNVTAYKYGDDNNDRAFTPFWGGRDENGGQSGANHFSHEVYLAGQASSYVEAREDLNVTITPEPLTAGCTPELLDPTAPLTFEVKWPDGKPVELWNGVPDPRGEDDVKKDEAWMHLFKDPHDDDQYYYPGKLLPQYYWLRTDLHNNDYSPTCNEKMYGFDTDPFRPIEFDWNPASGIYTFRGFVANDKGEFDVMIYTPDRRHKATATVKVAQPQVSYDLISVNWISGDVIQTPFKVDGSDDDFTPTGADWRYYVTTFTFKSAQGRLIQGLAESTSVCQGGEGQYARFTPFFTRHEYFNWVSPPGSTFRLYRRYPSHQQVWNFYINGNDFGGREQMVMFVDIDGSGQWGDIREELLLFNSNFAELGTRVGGEDGPLAPYYPTVNYMFEDKTYNHWQSWDGPFDKPCASPAGYGVGAIYNNPYDEMYLFADSNRDFAFNYQDSYLIDNRGQGKALVMLDDKCKYGAIVGVTKHALKPKFSDIYGGSDPYNEYSPQRTHTRFVHIKQGNEELGTSDGAYALDWDAFPDVTVDVGLVNAIPYWAETREEVGKDVLNPDNYDLAYGVENHLWIQFFPADSRDLPVAKGHTVTIGNGDNMHPWRGSKSENVVFSTIIEDNINPNARAAQMYVTPTGTGENILALNKTGISDGFYFDHCTSYHVLEFDVIMSIQVTADPLEPLKVGVPGTLVVQALKTAGGEPIPGATIHIKGAGVEMEKKSNENGEAVFEITPTSRGRITVTAEIEGMKGSYTTTFVERYVAPPKLDLDPVTPVTAQNSITIKGRTNEGTRITINGRPVTVAEDGTFSSLLKLEPGKNDIIITATNEADQTVTRVLVVESRTKPSEIIIDPLGTFENVSEIRLRGHVEPGTQVDVTNETTGNSAIKVTVSNDTFVADVAVQPGENELRIVATDPRTGKTEDYTETVYIWTTTELMFTVNSDVVLNNGVPEKLNVAPTSGDTGILWMPIADIAGLFDISPSPAGQAITLTWGTNTLVLTQGNAVAVLNGAQVELQAAPQIVAGMMMVALDDLRLLEPSNGELNIDIFEGTIVICRRK